MAIHAHAVGLQTQKNLLSESGIIRIIEKVFFATAGIHSANEHRTADGSLFVDQCPFPGPSLRLGPGANISASWKEATEKEWGKP